MNCGKSLLSFQKHCQLFFHFRVKPVWVFRNGRQSTLLRTTNRISVLSPSYPVLCTKPAAAFDAHQVMEGWSQKGTSPSQKLTLFKMCLGHRTQRRKENLALHSPIDALARKPLSAPWWLESDRKRMYIILLADLWELGIWFPQTRPSSGD